MDTIDSTPVRRDTSESMLITPANSAKSDSQADKSPSLAFQDLEAGRDVAYTISDSEEENNLFGGSQALRAQPTAAPSEAGTIDLTAMEDEKDVWSATRAMSATMAAERRLKAAPKIKKGRSLAFDETGSQATAPRRILTPGKDRAYEKSLPTNIPEKRKTTAPTAEKLAAAAAYAAAEADLEAILKRQPKRPETTILDSNRAALRTAAAIAPTPEQRKRDQTKAKKEAAARRRTLTRTFEDRYPDDTPQEIEARVQKKIRIEDNIARRYPQAIDDEDEGTAKKASATKKPTAAQKKRKRAAKDDDDASDSEDDYAPARKPAAKRAKKDANVELEPKAVNPNQAILPVDGNQQVIRYVVLSTDCVTDMDNLKGAIERRGEYLRRDEAEKRVNALAVKMYLDRGNDVVNMGNSPNASKDDIICTRLDFTDGTFCLFYVFQEPCRLNDVDPKSYENKKLSPTFMAQFQPRYDVFSYRYMLEDESDDEDDADEEEERPRKIKHKVEGSYTTMALANIAAAKVLAKYLLPSIDPGITDMVNETIHSMETEGRKNMVEFRHKYPTGDKDFDRIIVSVEYTKLEGAIELGEGLEEIE